MINKTNPIPNNMTIEEASEFWDTHIEIRTIPLTKDREWLRDENQNKEEENE